MLFFLKLFLVPSLIALVTFAGRRWGPQIAGWLSAFPIVAGPILLAIALEQGAAFASVAAANTLLAVLAILVFSIAYARNARRGMPKSMLSALLAYALAVVLLQGVSLPLWAGCAAVLAGLAGAPWLFGRAPDATPGSGGPVNDLPWRMLAGAILSLSVTYAAASLGPRLSGLFAMFPVMSTVLVGFSHRSNGAGFAVALLRGMIKGYVAFAVFCVILSVLLVQQPIATAFLLASGAALLVQLAMKWVMGAPQRASRANAA